MKDQLNKLKVEKPMRLGENPSLWVEAMIWGGVDNIPPILKYRLMRGESYENSNKKMAP